jgi:hypothetical protein
MVAPAAVAAALARGSPAQAEDWKAVGQAGAFGVGKAYQAEKGHVYWVGEQSGIFSNDKGKGSLFDLAGIKCPGFVDLDFNNKKAKGNGSCIISDATGDQAFLSWQAEGDPVNFHGTFEYTGGTGKYKGITGHNTYTGRVQVNWPDGTSSLYAVWNR